MGEVIIPPWVRPESPETIRWIDDATVAFPPAFGRGMTQRGIWADPRWGLRRRYRGLRIEQQAAILNALSESRGQLNKILVTPHASLRGSFPATELLSNNTFSNGTTGWTAYDSTSSIEASSDRVLRATLTEGPGIPLITRQITGLTQYAPYVIRAFMKTGSGEPWSPFVSIGSTLGGIEYASTDYLNVNQYGGAMKTAGGVVWGATSAYIAAGATDGETGRTAGDFLEFIYTSFSRCALADNGPNLLRQSNNFATSPWVLTNATSGNNGSGGPDGGGVDRYLQENTTNGGHYTAQQVAVSSVANDYVLTIHVKANTRAWCFLEILETTGSTFARMFFNASTGSVGSTSTQANWSNLRTSVVNMGNGWWRISLIARKTNAATTLQCTFGAASADGTASYAGVGTNVAHTMWHASLAQSSVPVRDTLTSSSSSSGTDQSGNRLYLKGLPASETGLLEIGDWIEVEGQLKRVTSRLNSDASGLGYVQCHPGVATSPADGAPVVIMEPFGRFIYAQPMREFENLFGLYGDCEMDLEEVYV